MRLNQGGRYADDCGEELGKEVKVFVSEHFNGWDFGSGRIHGSGDKT